jgi:hypothetical protein
VGYGAQLSASRVDAEIDSFVAPYLGPGNIRALVSTHSIPSTFIADFHAGSIQPGSCCCYQCDDVVQSRRIFNPLNSSQLNYKRLVPYMPHPLGTDFCPSRDSDTPCRAFMVRFLHANRFRKFTYSLAAKTRMVSVPFGCRHSGARNWQRILPPSLCAPLSFPSSTISVIGTSCVRCFPPPPAGRTR